MKLNRSLLLGIALLFPVSAFAIQNTPSPQMKAANELFNSQKFEAAAKSYEAIAAAEPNNARAWYQLGRTRFSLKQFESSISAFEKNIALNSNPTAMYNMACAFARLDKKEKAIEWLEKALTNNLSPFTNIAADPDLAGLQAEPRFKEMVATLDKKRRPCIYSDSARQFDFWIGEWDVFNPQGQKAGTSLIQQIADGCGILENWSGTLGGTGKSINFYDPATGHWYQYWIGANGMPSRYDGVYSDSAMRYEGEAQSAAGKVRTRLTFFNLDANTVRQLAERSGDDGKTWTTSYDFKYVRKKV
jgi:tetratricopeptide (TPR) repeat protein